MKCGEKEKPLSTGNAVEEEEDLKKFLLERMPSVAYSSMCARCDVKDECRDFLLANSQSTQ